MFHKTAADAVTYVLHRTFVPRGLATIYASRSKQYMATALGLNEAIATKVMDVMVEAAEAAREGAGQAFEDKLWYLIHDLERLNESLDSVRLERVIDRYKQDIKDMRPNEVLDTPLDPTPWRYALFGQMGEAREATQVTGGFVFDPRPEYQQEFSKYPA